MFVRSPVDGVFDNDKQGSQRHVVRIVGVFKLGVPQIGFSLFDNLQMHCTRKCECDNICNKLSTIWLCSAQVNSTIHCVTPMVHSYY